jgi:hypothetical protein
MARAILLGFGLECLELPTRRPDPTPFEAPMQLSPPLAGRGLRQAMSPLYGDSGCGAQHFGRAGPVLEHEQ